MSYVQKVLKSRLNIYISLNINTTYTNVQIMSIIQGKYGPLHEEVT